MPADYDAVASLYDRAFSDIRVRRDEWRWVSERFEQLKRISPPRVLDIGCGNGALLTALQADIHSGVGVDISTRFIELATVRARRWPHLRFQAITDATLPFPDETFDVVMSFLSFRYLDWDAVLREALRVLRPHGRVLIVDMVESQATTTDAWLLGRSLLQHVVRPLRDRRFHRDVAELTAHPDWARMLARNPIHHAEAYEACFQRWFPGRQAHALNATLTKRVIAFDSGPVRKP